MSPPSKTNYALTVTVAGAGSVVSSPTGINCSTTCSATFASGTTVLLTATPASGNAFTGWGGACSGTAASCSVAIDAARSVSATFTVAPVTQPVASIAVTPSVSVLEVGQNATLSAVTRAADNSVLTGRVITWTSSNTSLATVSATGVVSALAFGDTVRITASSEGRSATVAVFVRAPSVSIVASDAAASETGPDNGAFTIARTGPTTTALAVNLVIGGSATNGVDYAAVSTTVTIPAGQPSSTITIAPLVDAATEGAETVVISVAANAAYVVGAPGSATVTIADAVPAPSSNPAVTVVATDATASENGTDVGVFTISRTGLVLSALTVNVQLSGSATNGTDYAAVPTSVIIPVGQSSVTVQITGLPDPLVEGVETVVLSIAAGTGYDAGDPASASIAITDVAVAPGKPVVAVSAGSESASEVGPVAGSFTVSRSGATTSALVVNFALSGTATNGLDYVTVATSVTIPAGQSAATVVITPLSDLFVEGSETVIISLSANSNYDVGPLATASLNIADAPPPAAKPVITVTATDANASETGPDIGALELTRTGSTAAPLTVAIAMTGSASNGIDYALVTGSVVFAAGQSTVAVQITPIVDALVEGAETATLNIVASTTYDVGTPGSATVTIADGVVAPTLPAVTVVASDANASEVGLDAGAFTVTRSGATTTALNVSVNIGGTATNGTDYSTIATTVTIPVGQSAAVVSVSPLADILVEGAETVVMTIASSAAYTIGAPSAATVTIADAGAPVAQPQVTVVATDAAASEVGPDNGVFTVSRTGLPTNALVVNFALSGTAVNGTDYATLLSNVTIPAGAASVTVTVVPTTDALVEGAESVILTVSAGTGYDVGAPATATVTIADAGAPVAKPVVTITATDANASEVGADIGTFTFTRTGATSSTLSVTVTISGSATMGSDYSTVSTTVLIPLGATSSVLSIIPLIDALVEGPETVVFTIAPNAAYDVGTPSAATVTIADAPVAGGGSLVNGVTTTGRIAAKSQTDSWTFTATAGDRFIVSMGETGVLSTDFAPWIRVISPSGVQVSTYSDASAAQVELAATSTGTFTVLVGSGDSGTDGTGDYRLTLVKVPGLLTVSAGDQGGSLTNGALQAGNIYLGDVDAWTISAEAGERVIVSVAETGTFNASFAPLIRVYGPTGSLVTHYYDNAVSQVSFAAPSAGIYTVVIGSQDLNGIGEYRLTVVKAPGTFTTSPGDEGTTLVNGANHTGTITLADIDPWTITAAVGERVIVSMAETGALNASFAPLIRVYSPTGSLVAQYYDNAVSQVSFAAPTAGIYTIVVGSQDVNGTGDYRLTVVKAPGTFTTSPGDEGTTLVNGANHTGTITLADIDPWTITAAVGERVIVSMAETGALNASFAPLIRVYGPTGDLVAQYYDNAVSQVSFAAPTAGIYTIVIGSQDVNGIGDYRLTVVKAPGTFTTSPGDEGTTLVNGANHTGTITLADIDPWTITAAAGERVIVSMAETGALNASFAPLIRVYGPTGSLVTQYYDNAVSQVSFAAPTAGIYTIVIGSQDVNGTGDYRLTVVKAPGTFMTSPGDEGTTLVNGANHTGTITLADIDPWTITAAAGERVIVSMAETGAFNASFAPLIRVYGPTGDLVAQYYDNAVSQVSFAAPTAGIYTIVIGSQDVNGTGEYRLTVVKAPGTFMTSPGDEGTTMVNGANHTGTITLADIDPWTITAAVGERVIVSMAETGAFNASFAPLIRVYGPTGSLVTQYYDNAVSQVSFAAPTAGIYTIVIGSQDVNGIGDYRLTVVKAPGTFTTSPGDEGTTMVNGANHTGTITLADIDPWTITAAAGERVIVSMAETGAFNASFAPLIRVYGPTGDLVAQYYDNAVSQVSFAAPTAGIYTIVIGSQDVNGTGDYRLTVVKVPGTFTNSPGDDGGALGTTTLHNGTIALADIDPWTFSAVSGERIVVNLTKTGTFNSFFLPLVSIYGPTGALVTQTYDAVTAIRDFTATTTGTYTVVVGSQNLNGTGDYTIRLTRPIP